jgi:hypothetical protein
VTVPKAASGPAAPAIDPLRLLEPAARAPAIEAPAPAASAWFVSSRDAGALPGTASRVVDPLRLLGGAPDGASARLGEPVAVRDDAPALAAFFQPPIATAPVPADWLGTGIAFAAPSMTASRPAPRPASQAPSAAASHAAPAPTMAEAAADPLRLAVDTLLRAVEALRAACDDLRAGRAEDLAVARGQAAKALDRLAPEAIERDCEIASRSRWRPGASVTPVACWALYKTRHAEALAEFGVRSEDLTPATSSLDQREASHGLA